MRREEQEVIYVDEDGNVIEGGDGSVEGGDGISQDSSGFLKWNNDTIVAGMLIVGMLVVIYTWIYYKTLAKRASDTYNSIVHKVTDAVLETPVPTDWREVKITDLPPEEKEKVKTYALIQATYDSVTAAVVLIAGFYILSVLAKKDALNNIFGNTDMFDKLLGSLLQRNMLMILLCLLSIFTALYSMVNTFSILGTYNYPWYMRFWYGEKSEFYTPWNMITTLVISSLVAAFTINQLSMADSNEKSAVGWLQGLFKTNNKSESIFRYLTLAFGLFYMVYSFYGAYLYDLVTRSKTVHAYLYYLYPLFVSLLIAGVASYFGEGLGTGLVAFVMCAGLIIFRDFGNNVLHSRVLSDEQFWTSVFTWFQIIIMLLIVTVAILGFMKKLTSTSQAAVRTVNVFGRTINARAQKVSPSTLLVASFLGGFLFFSLQLFWSTTLALGDLTMAMMSAMVFALACQETTSYGKNVETAIYSGFAVTALFWFMSLQKIGFQLLVQSNDNSNSRYDDDDY